MAHTKKLPDLSFLEMWAGSPDVPPPPPAPTNEDNGRYFYLWHRPRDADSPQPESFTHHAHPLHL